MPTTWLLDNQIMDGLDPEMDIPKWHIYTEWDTCVIYMLLESKSFLFQGCLWYSTKSYAYSVL